MTRHSPLHEYHLQRRAKMADFGGWEMPIEYPADAGGGVLNEHQAVRQRVGLFDVSHLGKIEVRGEAALRFLNQILTNDLNRIVDGQAQYTMLCDDVTGGVVDDLIAYRRGSADFLLIPNAANTEEIARRLKAASPSGLDISNRHGDFGVIAIQGPASKECLAELDLKIELDYMQFTEVSIRGIKVILCRTGYTGEFGYEILPRWDDSRAIWDLLEDVVISAGGVVAGLGARDTLRTEMGYPLHGHELSLDITPVQAGLSWAVGWNKDSFWGKQVLVDERSRDATRVLRGVRLLDRGIPRAGMLAFIGGDEVGSLTSGTFSPSLKVGVGLGFFNSDLDLGTKVEIDIRGKLIEAELVKPPFLPSHVR